MPIHHWSYTVYHSTWHLSGTHSRVCVRHILRIPEDKQGINLQSHQSNREEERFKRREADQVVHLPLTWLRLRLTHNIGKSLLMSLNQDGSVSIGGLGMKSSSVRSYQGKKRKYAQSTAHSKVVAVSRHWWDNQLALSRTGTPSFRMFRKSKAPLLRSYSDIRHCVRYFIHRLEATLAVIFPV